jgi:threonine dehydratase
MTQQRPTPQPPTRRDIEEARDFIAPHLPPTPLVHSPGLSGLLGCAYHVKCENLQPVGAFKVRGGVNLVGRLGDEAGAGIVSASTGNHGQSLAYAGRLFNVPVVIFAPAENTNPLKLEAMRELGADVRLYGRDFDEAREQVEQVAKDEGLRYVHSANEPRLIAGVGTMGLEILEDLPDVEVVLVPVGGGSGACGIALAVKHARPETRIIGVQAERAPACYRAWKERRLDLECPMETSHEGLATRVPFEMTMRIMWEMLDDLLLVSEESIATAIQLLARHARQVAEGAGAAALAGALQMKEKLAGKKVVGILSGGNLPLDRYAAILNG